MKNSREKVDLGLNNHLNIEPSEFEKKYGILIKFNNDKGKEKGLMSYEIRIQAKRTDAHSWLYRFDKTNIRINDQKPHENLDILATECHLALYPLEIETGRLNDLRRIRNIEEIRGKWIIKRNMLKEKFDLEIVDWYLKKTEESIVDETLLSRTIGQDIFLTFYMAPVYRVYGMLTNMTEADVHIPILPNVLPVLYSTEIKIDHHYSKFDTIRLEQEGGIIDERSAYDLVTLKDIAVTPSDEINNGRVKTIYHLHRDSKIIQSVIADCNIELPYNKGRSFRMEAFEI